MTGGGGNDTMDGGPGIDTFNGNDGDDTFRAQDDEATRCSAAARASAPRMWTSAWTRSRSPSRT
jgi:hypothetical protein